MPCFIPYHSYSKIDKNWLLLENLAHIERQSVFLIETLHDSSDRSRAVVLVLFLLTVFGVGVSCRILFSFVVYLYVSGSESITSVGEERAYLSAVVYL